MKSHFEMMARYNCWANARLYAMAAELPGELYKKPIGVFFKSLHGTLNHLLAADRIWLRRLTGAGDHPSRLDAIVHEDFAALRSAREAEDERIIDYVRGLDEAELGKLCRYETLNGTPQQQSRREILAHLFNHQAHHRGQAHAVLTLLGIDEPTPLDLLIMQRETP